MMGDQITYSILEDEMDQQDSKTSAGEEPFFGHRPAQGEFSISPDGRLYFAGTYVGRLEAKTEYVPHPDHQHYARRLEFTVRAIDVTSSGTWNGGPIFSSSISASGTEGTITPDRFSELNADEWNTWNHQDGE